jgi:hypothetical protein
VSEAVVDQLEPVEVERQQREPPRMPAVAGDLVVQPLVQQPAVAEAGQRVLLREQLQAELALVEPPLPDPREHPGGEREQQRGHAEPGARGDDDRDDGPGDDGGPDGTRRDPRDPRRARNEVLDGGDRWHTRAFWARMHIPPRSGRPF